ncbi:hypothetical protein PIB30_038026 [Stylosanthes scabra]|uniref:Uncharacterized protein n=1 Tax=Stylosanthes scabra TaxID=79078 RepID=A0ABU6TDK4_9FABA|nr:hypothetical protein [Stylosanthes scabra]
MGIGKTKGAYLGTDTKSSSTEEPLITEVGELKPGKVERKQTVEHDKESNYRKENSKKAEGNNSRRTNREADGDGANLDWHHDAIFNLSWITPLLLEGSDDLSFRFEFRHDGTFLDEKFIGECGILVGNLVCSAATTDLIGSHISWILGGCCV